ncbi:PREDICTED: uncharacterized protein LOC104804180 isoform X2 [Tarenaya hassleriana]|uniref:uncharacterized protein LOC104804180 isoform X2 n=1 Tax=Tarenaya hassleriana TaxID=28532 RepID=UPI00053C24FC|nr:PREDICTED: uncharacterized protein LOC104804180 isoform X2 [Tarenaya hassleriana]
MAFVPSAPAICESGSASQGSASSNPAPLVSRDPYSDPLFLHAADSSSVFLVSEKLHGEANYGVWSRAVRKALLAKNKLGFILGTIPQPVDDEEDSGSWLRCNAMVCTWLSNSVDPDILTLISYMEDAHEIWMHLQNCFLQTNVSKLYSIQHQIDSLYQGSLNLNSYFTKLNALWKELKHFEPLPVCSCKGCTCGGCKCRISDQWSALFERRSVVRFLMRLNDSFSAARRQILMSDPLPDLTRAYNLVAQEEQQKLNVSCLPDAVAFSTTTNSSRSPYSFPSSNPPPKSPSPYPSTSSNRPRPICTHCGMTGHVVSRCFRLHGYPPGHKSHPNWNSRSGPPRPKSQSLEKAQNQVHSLLSQLLSQHKGQGSVSLDSNFAVPSPPSPGISLVTYPLLTTSPSNITFPTAVWILDTGASTHVCCNLGLFSEVHDIPVVSVSLPNGSSLKVTQAGTVLLSSSITLSSVLFIPTFHYNLLSVSCLTQQTSCSVHFFRDSFIIQDLTRGLMIGKGKQLHNLYILEMLHTSSTTISLPSKFCTTLSATTFDLWHHRLGHPSDIRVHSIDKSSELKFSTSETSSISCPVCPLAKQRRLSFPVSSHVSKFPFELLHVDVWGPCSEISTDGHRFFLSIVDDYSRCTWVYLLKSKSDVLQKFPEFVSFVENQFNASIKCVRSDNAPELGFKSLFAKKGILHQFSCPYTPQQNSIVERKHQHILNVARALLFQSNVPLAFWGDCILTSVYLINRTPSPLLQNKTPFELLTGCSPSYSHLRVFGCLCYVSTLTKDRHKFNPRAMSAVFLGYPHGVKGYKVLDLHSNAVLISRNVVFHETTFPFKSFPQSQPALDPFPQSVSPFFYESISPQNLSSSSALSPVSQEFPTDPISSLGSSETDSSGFVTSSSAHVTRPQRQSKTPAYLSDYHCYLISHNSTPHPNPVTPYPLSACLTYDLLSPSYRTFALNITTAPEPQSYTQAAKFESWRQAMKLELEALIRTNTWSICTLPDGKNAVGCKWVFKTKYNADGSIERHKARLVAKGYTQLEGVDFSETFSPVAKMTTVRVLLALAAKYNWLINQMDVSNAFLNGDLDEEIYMKLPPGYSDLQGEKVSSSSVCKLQRSLYGLKQASRQWNQKLSQVLLAAGFLQVQSDNSLFLKRNGSQLVAVLVYVDDLLITGNDAAMISDLKDTLHSSFEIKDLGPLHYFLGLEVARSKQGPDTTQRADICNGEGICKTCRRVLLSEMAHLRVYGQPSS